MILRNLVIIALVAVGFSSHAATEPAPGKPGPRMRLSEFAELHKYSDKTEKRGKDRYLVLVKDERSPEAKERLKSLMRGVQVMKSRKPSDPKSWFFQAAVHGVTPEAIAEAAKRDPDVLEFVASGNAEKFWNQCPHNKQPSADFLVWHRAYVYYFERILREASGDPTLSLPFWDYTGGESVSPPAFSRQHVLSVPEMKLFGLPTNPLFDGDRELAMNNRGATQLSDFVTKSWGPLEAELLFFGKTEDAGFAGAVGDDDESTKGMLERNPHDNIHIAIGGIIGDETGLMADVPQAAFDPIFWVHHCNVDRLWTKWDNLPDRKWGYFPSAAWFVETPWQFYDVDGQVKRERRSFYFDNARLGIRYSDVIDTPTRLTASLPFDVQAFESEVTTLASKLAPGPENAAHRPTMLDLAGGEKGVAEKMKPRIDSPARKPQVWLTVEYTRPSTIPNVAFSVVLKATVGPNKDKEIDLGPLVIFGAGHVHGTADEPMSHAGHGNHAHGHAGANLNQRFNVTDHVTGTPLESANFTVTLKMHELLKSSEPISRRDAGVKIVKTSFGPD